MVYEPAHSFHVTQTEHILCFLLNNHTSCPSWILREKLNTLEIVTCILYLPLIYKKAYDDECQYDYRFYTHMDIHKWAHIINHIPRAYYSEHNAYVHKLFNRWLDNYVSAGTIIDHICFCDLATCLENVYIDNEDIFGLFPHEFWNYLQQCGNLNYMNHDIINSYILANV